MKYSSKQYAWALSEVLEKNASEKKGAAIKNFVKLLRAKRDLNKIPFIENELRKFDLKKLGFTEARVSMPFTASKDTENKIKNFISGFLHKEENKIKLVNEIDETLIGGFVAKADGFLIDVSVKNMLVKLKRNLK